MPWARIWPVATANAAPKCRMCRRSVVTQSRPATNAARHRRSAAMSVVDDATATMIANFPARTGRSLEEWVEFVRASGKAKHGEIMTLLKTDHGMSHGFANFVALTALKPADIASPDDLVEAMYAGSKASLRPLHDAAIEAAQAFGADVELAPKKAYVSLRRKKQFGTVGPASGGRVEVGLNLKDVGARRPARGHDRDVHPSRPDRLARRARPGAARLAPPGIRRRLTADRARATSSSGPRPLVGVHRFTGWPIPSGAGASTSGLPAWLAQVPAPGTTFRRLGRCDPIPDRPWCRRARGRACTRRRIRPGP